MKSLLIIAHGSRRSEANEEIRRLTQALRKLSGARFSSVDYAFLELAQPSVPDGIDNCILGGANEIIIFPYFLSAGRHVTEDIPSHVIKKRDEYPDVRFTIAPHLGVADRVAEYILAALV
jgi:sirohydrochlorin ferrochelatase